MGSRGQEPRADAGTNAAARATTAQYMTSSIGDRLLERSASYGGVVCLFGATRRLLGARRGACGYLWFVGGRYRCSAAVEHAETGNRTRVPAAMRVLRAGREFLFAGSSRRLECRQRAVIENEIDDAEASEALESALGGLLGGDHCQSSVVLPAKCPSNFETSALVA